MKLTWKVILLIMLAGFVGWRVMAQEPPGTRPSSGQKPDANELSGGQQSNPAAQTNSGVPISGAGTLTRGADRAGEPGGTVKGDADVSDLSITAVPMTSDELSTMIEKARQIASQMESASIHRANEARLSMERWDPADVAGRDRLRKELRLFVMRAFEARHALQRMEVDLLAMKLQAMDRKLEEQETKASEIIERRIDDLLNPNLRWDDSAIKNSTTGRPLAFDGIRALTASEAASITAQNHSTREAASELSKRITECMESLIRLRGLQQKAASKGSNNEHLATQIKDEEQRLRNLMGLPNIDGQRITPTNAVNPPALERIQEAKAVSPPQLFGAKTPAGVLTYDGNVQEWIGGDRSGTVLPDGAFKPVPNATIHLYRVSPIAKGGSGYQFEEIEVFKSDKQGHFKINIPDNLKRFIQTPGTIEWDDWESVLLITTSAPGFATDSTTLAANRSLDSIELIRGTSIRGRLVDEHERPIVGAHVTVNAQSRATSREEMDEWLRQTSKEPLPKATVDPADTDALLAARTHASIANHDVQWIPTQIEGVVTDQEGRFTMDGIGPDDVLDLNVECFGYNNARIKVIGRDIESVYSRDPFASGENIAVHGRTFQATLIASYRGTLHSRHRVIKGERKKDQVEQNLSDASAKDK